MQPVDTVVVLWSCQFEEKMTKQDESVAKVTIWYDKVYYKVRL